MASVQQTSILPQIPNRGFRVQFVGFCKELLAKMALSKNSISNKTLKRRGSLQQIMRDFKIRRAMPSETDTASAIVEEYYEAMNVVARDTREEFARLYFADGAGVWLARLEERVIGCIALRAMRQFSEGGEVKRLYVQPKYRGRGIAVALHNALETYARKFGYQWLYLDTTDNMTSAIRFYEQQSYKRCARYNENPQATIFMRKELHAPSEKTKR
jgi:GNAT superfamily N-acetyltransferase